MQKDFQQNTNFQVKPWIKALLVGFLALNIISIVILASVPPVSRDALTHHLAIPKLYLKHGGLYEIPDVEFSYYPMNLDLLYMIPLYFGNDIIPKYIHFAFALLTSFLIFRYLKIRLDSLYALFGVVLFLSLPIILKLSITVYVDLGLVFFSTAALIYLFKWIDNDYKIKYLLVPAVFCGLAMGTKYNGLIVLFILSLFIPFVFISGAKKKIYTKDSGDKSRLINIQLKAVGFGIIFFFSALLVFSPWMIRNYVWKANPIYPLYDQIFNRHMPVSPDTQKEQQINGPAADPQQTFEAKSTRWGPFAIRKVIYGESWWEIALIPVRVFFEGQDDSPKHFDGKLSPFLFLLPFFAFFQKKGTSSALRTERKIFIYITILFIMYAFSTTNIRIRYIVPIIPPLVILATFGFHNIASTLANRWKNLPNWFVKFCILFLSGALISYNGIYIFQQFKYVEPFSYISGQISRDDYIVKYRPEYSIYQYANRNLADNVKILGLFLGNRYYYSDRELIFGVNKFRESVNRSNSADILFNDMKENGYTHLIIRLDLFNRWMSKQFGERKKEMLKKFSGTYIRPILLQDGYGLFELRSI
jgi:hypothetical protein